MASLFVDIIMWGGARAAPDQIASMSAEVSAVGIKN
jgi:hypothetical protein